jgi:hypothetical protein
VLPLPVQQAVAGTAGAGAAVAGGTGGEDLKTRHLAVDAAATRSNPIVVALHAALVDSTLLHHLACELLVS